MSNNHSFCATNSENELMERVFLISGSNMGNRFDNLNKASNLIQKRIGPVIDKSSVYESVPWGFNHPDKFLNQVLEVETTKDPETLLMQLQEIEKALGRIRNSKRYSARSIDIDILFYGKLILKKESLVIPHPRIAERRFVLVPLCELIPDYQHPVLGETIHELLNLCEDKAEVTVFNTPEKL